MDYRFVFILEQTLGHITHSQNLRKYVSEASDIEAFWGLPAWESSGLAQKIPVYRSNWTLQAGLRTRKILGDLNRRSRLDALFFHTQVTAVLSRDWLRRIPSVVSLDATPKQYDRLGTFYAHLAGPSWLENWKWRLNRDSFRLAHRLVTWSEWAKDGLVDEYEVPPEKVSVIPPGVDTRAWARPEPRGLESRPVRILFVGGDLERKGGRLLLEAFRYLRENLVSTLAGGTSIRLEDGEALGLELHMVTREALESEPGVFVHHGVEPNSDRLKQLFFESDIFCLPTQGDCLPMVLSEAGAAGLPSISTQVAAIPEIVHGGETGLLIPSGDLKALTTALEHLILDRDLRLRQGQAAEQVVRLKYDAGRNANRLLDLMKQVSDRPSAERPAG